MSNATKDIATATITPGLLSFPVAAAAKVYAGTMGATDASGNLVSTLTAASKVWGRVERQTDNTSGAAGDLSADVRTGAFFWDNDVTNACTNALPRGTYVYAVDNHTVGTSDLGGTLPLVGYLIDVPASGAPSYGKVLVATGRARPDALDPELGGASLAFKARCVATNLAALTFTGGTFLANANGALGTQDGLTIAAGDVVVFPAGTITTGVVSAANSGPWIFTSVGGSGKFSGIRPDWWAHGASVVPGAAINVGGEGTLFGGTRWPTFAAASVVIGTGDPALYPERVTQQVTLSAGTKTISNVPIFATARLGLSVGLVGGTPDATTTGYNFRITSGRTAGGIGTASAIVDAQAVAGGAKVAGDVAVINVTLLNG